MNVEQTHSLGNFTSTLWRISVILTLYWHVNKTIHLLMCQRVFHQHWNQTENDTQMKKIRGRNKDEFSIQRIQQNYYLYSQMCGNIGRTTWEKRYYEIYFSYETSRRSMFINPFATGNTLVCDWIFESVDIITVYSVLWKHFFKIL